MTDYVLGDCTICYRSLTLFDAHNVNCNHIYHKECITNWINKGAKNCPQCSEPATINGIKRYFVEAKANVSPVINNDQDIVNTTTNTQNSTQNLQIIVNDLFNVKTVLPGLKPSNTIKDMKYMIENLRGWPADNQTLSYHGQTLENDLKFFFFKFY
ncbi:hypothetical protein Mgra_00000689 [Meloidogyne graminicola]|uniref:RING-type domain-containing protein n=1 Tax=Meloidogyne graminicola TaxID=189291 RepID=A0A8T0A313_9BILA|nr:hypothetical protein Mgra_00000689 [Meloidogyne graminicola]